MTTRQSGATSEVRGGGGRRFDVRTAVAALVASVLIVFGAATAQAAASTDGGGAVVISGAPLVHTFDLRVPGDAVTGEWQIGSAVAELRDFDGVLVPVEPSAAELARALTVSYGSIDADGAGISWHAAGTLAEPRSYADVLGHSPTVAAGQPVRLPVRVALPEPEAVSGAAGEVLLVSASFVVSYLGGEVSVGTPGGGGVAAWPPVLAVTGWGPWWLLAAAVVSITVGAELARQRRDARNAPTGSGGPDPSIGR